MPMLPLVLAAGVVTMYRLASAGVTTGVTGSPEPKFESADWMMVSAPVPLPVTARRPLLPLVCAEVMPNCAPRSRSKVSLTTTMRASISTCRTGTSSVCTRRRISARFSTVSRTPAGRGTRRADHFRQVGHLGVVCLQEFRAQRGEILDLLVSRELRLLARRELFRRTDDDHVILAALVESLGAQHDVERLVPGDILQAQGEVAGDRVAHHDILAAGVGQQLEHRAYVDVLEIQGQTLAGVFLLFIGRGAFQR